MSKQITGESWDGLCQAWVEQQTLGHTGVYPSALSAWNQQQNKAVKGTLTGIQPGDLVYFDANSGNGGYGHTGIYRGNGQFVSATDNGIAINSIAEWQKGTGQNLLGYIPQKASPFQGQQLSSADMSIQQNAQSMQQKLSAYQQQQAEQQRQQQAVSEENAFTNWFSGYKQQTANNIMASITGRPQSITTLPYGT